MARPACQLTRRVTRIDSDHRRREREFFFNAISAEDFQQQTFRVAATNHYSSGDTVRIVVERRVDSSLS